MEPFFPGSVVFAMYLCSDIYSPQPVYVVLGGGILQSQAGCQQ